MSYIIWIYFCFDRTLCEINRKTTKDLLWCLCSDWWQGRDFGNTPFVPRRSRIFVRFPGVVISLWTNCSDRCSWRRTTCPVATYLSPALKIIRNNNNNKNVVYRLNIISSKRKYGPLKKLKAPSKNSVSTCSVLANCLRTSNVICEPDDTNICLSRNLSVK